MEHRRGGRMDDKVKQDAQAQAEIAYTGFLSFLKWMLVATLFIFVLLVRCNLGVDT